MAWHTLKETVKLTGRSRRSLYRDMAKGLVSYGLDVSGSRQFDTAELIRAYGELENVAQGGSPKLTQVGTSIPWELVLTEMVALRSEIETLRAAIHLIEHKPEPKPEKPSASAELRSPATWESIFKTLDD